MSRGPVKLAFRVDERGPGHTKVSVFVGRQVGSRGHSGQLVFRTDEWDELSSGLGPPGETNMVEAVLRKGGR